MSWSNYRLLGLIGEGQITTAHLARFQSPWMSSWVVIERLSPGLAHRPALRRAFLAGVRGAMRLSHASIVTLFEAGEDDGTVWVSAEYLHGVSLLDALEAAPVGFAEAAEIVARAAEGLGWAADLRDRAGAPTPVLHHKLCSQNVFLTHDGAVKLIDFCSPPAEVLTEADIDPERHFIAYLAPELARGAAIDPRGEVFALGVMLWELLAGRPLFLAATALATFESVLRCAVPRPASFRAGCPPLLEAIALDALSRDPARRTATPHELGRQLRGYLAASSGRPDLEGHLARAFGARRARQERWLADLHEGL